jgi:hypothetical protein
VSSEIMSLRSFDPLNPCLSVARFWYSRVSPRLRASGSENSGLSRSRRSRAITAIRPPPLFFHLLLQTKTLTPIDPWGLPCVTLGWPLGGPRVAQGPPKPNPSQAEGRNHKTQKRNGISIAHLSKMYPKKRDCQPEEVPFIWLRFRAPFRARFWREWAEQPNRPRGIGSAGATGPKNIFAFSVFPINRDHPTFFVPPAPLCTHPFPMSPNPPKNRQRVATIKHKNATESSVAPRL